MNLQELQLQIKNKQLINSIYIFTGDEIAIQKIYINKMSKLANLEVQYVEDYKSICNKLNSTNIFNVKKLYVILDDTEFIKQEKVWSSLITQNINGNILIFKYNTLDKRSKFYKTFVNDLVEFNKLSEEVLIRYIQNELPALSNENCEKLIQICNSNYNQILLEINKIKNYSNSLDNDNYLFEKLNEQRSIS